LLQGIPGLNIPSVPGFGGLKDSLDKVKNNAAAQIEAAKQEALKTAKEQQEKLKADAKKKLQDEANKLLKDEANKTKAKEPTKPKEVNPPVDDVALQG